MKVRTFQSMFPRKLDQLVNEFVARPDVEVHQLHVSTSFGNMMITVEYEPRSALDEGART